MYKYRGVERSPVTIIIFSILTCGIYFLYWLWQLKEDVNGILGREEMSTGLFIACIFVPYLYLLMLYKADNALKETCPQRGVNYNPDNFMIWLILDLLTGVGVYVAMYQIQEPLNNIWKLD